MKESAGVLDSRPFPSFFLTENKFLGSREFNSRPLKTTLFTIATLMYIIYSYLIVHTLDKGLSCLNKLILDFVKHFLAQNSSEPPSLKFEQV